MWGLGEKVEQAKDKGVLGREEFRIINVIHQTHFKDEEAGEPKS